MSTTRGSEGHDGAQPHQPDPSPAGELQILHEDVPPPSQLNDALVVGLAVAAAIAGVVFAVTLVAGGPLVLYGGALGVGLLCLSYAVRRYFTDRFPDVEAIEERLAFDSLDSLDPVDRGADGQAGEPRRPRGRRGFDLAEVPPLGRRPLLRRLLIGASAVFGLSLLAPVTTLGPSPGGAFRRTAWARGVRLVTTDGRLVRPDDLAVGAVSTVWPEEHIDEERASTVLIRLYQQPRPPTNLEWVVADTIVAYSKVCTHAGCPVALYRQREDVLFCPCHQSTFEVDRGAVPTFGPAARALPQLPLGVDGEGYLVALSDFAEPVGPAFG